ncbi:hypothetical protein [Rugamonas sp.]|uniref:hypothetical protein n=1 Tax=Rugamonas sp. TaxID=1926287 RepID=UPI0025DFD7DF|nr:hypothetical protein [Rugamonas sp.]
MSDLRLPARSEALALEPHWDRAGALLPPGTGIIDSHALMLSLAEPVCARLAASR